MYHTKMIRNPDYRFSFSVSLIVALFVHMLALLFVKKRTFDFHELEMAQVSKSRPIKIDHINLIKPEETPAMRRVGVKDGKKTKYFQPDQLKFPKPMPAPSPGLSLGNLAANLPKTIPNSKPQAKVEREKVSNTPALQVSSSSNDSSSTHFYFNPKKEKKIARNTEQDNLKQEAYKNIPVSSSNPVAQKLSNFEIRYERPEGVSEDELNSDEKAYYAFFKRSYANYLQKLYATYDKVSVERPGIDKDLEGQHLLIGKIDYDEKGNIVTVKILKSSDSDNVHYFFEETLKQLNLPNPPKSFIKSKKGFTTYYQIQIN